MKVLAFNGSPRADKGVTDLLLQQFLAGAEDAGAETETIYLSRKKINYCKGCLNCWLVHPGKCVQKDDMVEILDKWKGAEMIVYASPVYVDGFTAQMKTMMDRFVTIGQPFIMKRDGHSRHPGNEKYRRKDRAKTVLISTCGFGETDNFDSIIFHMKAITRNMFCEHLGELIRPMGPVLQLGERDPGKTQPVLEAFRQAGYEAVTKNEISEEIRKRAASPIISMDEFMEMVNSFAKEEIEKNKARQEVQ
jgi:multimeric flavodoxin WrbA